MATKHFDFLLNSDKTKNFDSKSSFYFTMLLILLKDATLYLKWRGGCLGLTLYDKMALYDIGIKKGKELLRSKPADLDFAWAECRMSTLKHLLQIVKEPNMFIGSKGS